MISPSDAQVVRTRGLFRDLGEFGERALFYASLMRIHSELPIDVVIPAAEKDVAVLGLAIDGIRRNAKHPIQSIFVVSPRSGAIEGLCRRKRCHFVYERDLLKMDPTDIGLVVNGLDRSKWIYQQFLKWSGDALAETTHYLVVDADTVLIRPQVFERGGRIILNYGDEYHRPYFEMYRRLLKEAASSPVSFTSHQTLFDKRVLGELKERIEYLHGCSWTEAIMKNIDPREPSGSSDYETYGQYMFLHHAAATAVEYWFNLSLRRTRNLRNVTLLALQYAGKYKSLSFHSYQE